MILAIHELAGAAIIQLTPNPVLGAILAFLSHYVLDAFPHIEYKTKEIEARSRRGAPKEFGLATIDSTLGILAILSVTSPEELLVTLMGAFVAILPDGFSVLSFLIQNKLLALQLAFHKKIHAKRKWSLPEWVAIVLGNIALAFGLLLVLIYFG